VIHYSVPNPRGIAVSSDSIDWWFNKIIDTFRKLHGITNMVGIRQVIGAWQSQQLPRRKNDYWDRNSFVI
jgi:hypothetical protein